MTINWKLSKIQSEIKANKSQFNKFGNYKYRSLEDITEAFKPFADKYKVALVISDGIEMVGDRYYIKATATLLDGESDGSIPATGYAREALDQKGMSEGQLTGSTSSYARKYACNGLFALDDNKDDDTRDNSKKPAKPKAAPKAAPKPVNLEAEIKTGESEIEYVSRLLEITKTDEAKMFEALGVEDMAALIKDKTVYKKAVDTLKKKVK